MKYVAASVPRSFRLSRPGLFPPSCLIGSLVMSGYANEKGASTSTLIRDVIMMRETSFQNMKANASVSLVLSPALRLGGAGFAPGFVFTDTRKVVVPDSEPDPELFAKTYFLERFGVTKGAAQGPETGATRSPSLPQKATDAAQEIFGRSR